MNEVITVLPIEDVYPNPRHYREVRPDAVRKLAASIGVIGQTDPVLVRRDGAIYYVESGHHRLEALKQLGHPTIKAIVLDELDDAAAAQLMVAANLHEPETELERSRGAQMMLSTGVRPLDAAAHLGENQDKLSKAARAFARLHDDTHAEDLTLDQAAAASEFEDEDAFRAVMDAPANTWRAKYDSIVRQQKLAEAIARAEAIIAAAGCELIKHTDMSKHQSLSLNGKAPEGAKWATIYANEWSPSSVTITWYGEVGEQTESVEDAAAREKAEALRAAGQAASDRRVAWLVDYLNSATPVSFSNALRDLAVGIWEGTEDEPGVDASVAFIEKAPWSTVTGFTPRVYASILTHAEYSCDAAFRHLFLHQHLYNPDEKYAAAHVYLHALTDCGYELSEPEQEMLRQLEEEDGGDE